jgi:hypothetical protein
VRRGLAYCLVAVAALAPGWPAGAKPVTTVSVVTVLGASTPSPRATVDASWQSASGSDTVHASGFNPPAARTTVSATWTGTRQGDARGRFLRLEHRYSYDALLAGATYDVVIEIKTGGSWQRVFHVGGDYVGTIDGTAMLVDEVYVFRSSLAVRRTVPVRVTLTVVYPEPAFDIDDSISVAPV